MVLFAGPARAQEGAGLYDDFDSFGTARWSTGDYNLGRRYPEYRRFVGVTVDETGGPTRRRRGRIGIRGRLDGGGAGSGPAYGRPARRGGDSELASVVRV